ncbi:nicotinamidase-related amidase [Catenuloplanes nepalensis]|uniref:Nicotinamidase-related amidase n=1 Tax=Catenuloplanes nepalensis TaxID=587533 RepID=A0ABT9MWB8_9ACTN|nr:cysteine hydrolase family protein [Catenuloplanes nepalensis]MDP9795556.1 nicotinamidase-related amidase [Catenuloplanes nepalensis]
MTQALIVVDVQESFRRGPRWGSVSVPDIAARVGRLVADARERGETVVWVLHAEPGIGGPFDPASGFVRMIDGLEPLPGEPVLTKTTRNAFTGTDLQRLLTLAGTRELAICGIQTEQCCETTARVAADLGFDVVFVTEATATFPIPHRSLIGRDWDEILADPRTLGTDAVVERTEYALAGRFATIRTVAEVVSR